MSVHFFLIEDLGSFAANLEAKGYRSEMQESVIEYSKSLSGALVKYYAYAHPSAHKGPTRIRVSYQLVDEGDALRKILRKLKDLNFRYRQTLEGWKTKREPSKTVRERRWNELEDFLHLHGELIACFKYEADDRLTEGNPSFNLQVASTPKEQAVCLEFIKALAEAHTPYGIVRRRREADGPLQQRNGWIRRYAQLHRKRGWAPLEIAREIQKELRDGTWNERSRLQYNIANNTICKIAGIKISRPHHQTSYREN